MREVSLIESVIRNITAEAALANRPIDISFQVDDEATEAIALMDGAKVERTLYCPSGEPPYVIRSAKVKIGDVRLSAQAHGRDATVREMDTVGEMMISEPKPYAYKVVVLP